MKLTPVDAWTNSTDFYRGKYRNEQGLGLSGLYRRDYRQSSEMIVLNNGNLIGKYKYPKVQHSFDTPMLRWQNLYFCGGYDVRVEEGKRLGSNDLLVDAVVKGLKPIGFIVVEETEVNKYIKKAIDNGLKYSINPHFWDDHCEIGVANIGKLEERFNFDNLIEAYSLYSKDLGYEVITEGEKEWLYGMAKLQLSDFICDFDYSSSEKSICEHILTGLLLGYPIESTVALIDYNIS